VHNYPRILIGFLREQSDWYDGENCGRDGEQQKPEATA
jgi:hypothetical protein